MRYMPRKPRHDQIQSVNCFVGHPVGDIVKPLEDTIDSISRENRNLTKKISLLESERQFYETETRRSLDLKGAQKEPMNLSSKGKTNPKNSVSWTIPGD